MKTLRALTQLIGLWIVITTALAAAALVLLTLLVVPADPPSVDAARFSHSRGTT